LNDIKTIDPQSWKLDLNIIQMHDFHNFEQLAIRFFSTALITDLPFIQRSRRSAPNAHSNLRHLPVEQASEDL
jgi:hypothetical protein